MTPPNRVRMSKLTLGLLFGFLRHAQIGVRINHNIEASPIWRHHLSFDASYHLQQGKMSVLGFLSGPMRSVVVDELVELRCR